jgi:DNA-binding PadR family transcriptional regulator
MSPGVKKAVGGSPGEAAANSEPDHEDPVNATAAVLLGLLLLGPAPATEGFGEHRGMTGWQLHETVLASVGAFWNITRSQIYLELDRLAATGLVDEIAGGGRRGQRPYRITPRGRAAFERWIAELAREEPRADQLRSPLTLLVFFGEHVPPGLLRRALQAQRLMRERRLEQLQAMLATLDSSDRRRLPTAVLQRGIALARLHLDWIDDVLRLLDDA